MVGAGNVDKPAKKLFRCAIYTRKSTEHNLDLEFNSLDAQREACEAYIKSQAHEGWRPAPGQYDDGAFSGASLDRPALQKLLAEVHAGRVDIIVVYKVDRLTRSLADFAKLVELFDQHSVSFVSVTQSFNTTSSMGRLTLNVLLSFAQFEREVIGERVRDKIAASKKKGIWVGGAVPMGYASVNKKLVVVPDEAETVRLIFRRYLELGSIGALISDLDKRGIRTRRQKLADGSIRGGIPFGVGGLNYLLRNRYFIGEVVYHGAVYRGEQEPIVDRDLFDAVQEKLSANGRARELKLKASPSILIGRLFDDRGNRMTPSHTNKQGARYRYYVSHAIVQKRKDAAGSVTRVPAHEIETTVVEAVRRRLDSSGGAQPDTPPTERELIERHVERITIKPQSIEVHLVGDSRQRNKPRGSKGGRRTNSKSTRPTFITVPWTANASPAAKGAVHSPSHKSPMSEENREELLTAIAKARGWIEDLAEGRVASFAEIARTEGKVERHIRLLAQLAFVSPMTISAIVGRTLLNGKVTELAKAAIPTWAKQQKLGIAGYDQNS
jgi:DNA invertase Pin-like site-specific DNA recombinase